MIHPFVPVDNTATLLTPPGAAAIAVVRLAGPGVEAFLARHFSRATSGGRCVHGTLSDERGEVLDDPVVVRLPGDDAAADVSLHGGAWVVQSVMNLAARVGFQLPDPATKSWPAHDADNALEHEVLEYLPLARTELALRTLLAQPEAWRNLKLRVNRREDAVTGELEAALDDRALTHFLCPPRVAIVGAPNVGKSTLANQLFAQERSITADLPGTTRDWVGEIANVDGLAVMLVDTPGVRETPDPVEREAIARATGEARRADLVVLVLDATQALEPEQGALLLAYPGAVRVINKSDRPARWEGASAAGGIRTVATSGQGVDQVRRAILEHFACWELALERPRVWTERQRQLVRDAVRDRAALSLI